MKRLRSAIITNFLVSRLVCLLELMFFSTENDNNMKTQIRNSAVSALRFCYTEVKRTVSNLELNWYSASFLRNIKGLKGISGNCNCFLTELIFTTPIDNTANSISQNFAGDYMITLFFLYDVVDVMCIRFQHHKP